MTLDGAAGKRCSITLVSCCLLVLSGCREEAPLAASHAPATRAVTVAALPRPDSTAAPRPGAQIRSAQAAASAGYAFRASSEGSLAENAEQRLTTRVAPDGVQVVAAEGGAPLTLHFVGIGRGDTLAAVRASRAPAVERNAVTLDREGVREWYVNGPLGLEQGFTLPAPTSAGSEPLTLAIDVDAPWRLATAGDGVVMTDASSGRTLHYGALTAYDAAQRELPSRLEVTGQRIALRVDDRGAVYPIEIDPLVSVNEYQTNAPGENVAIGGDTLVSGTGSSNNKKAYIFSRTGSTWAYLTQLSDNAVYYGSSVAVDGDVLAVGARWDSAMGAGVGSAFIYDRSGTSWTQTTKLYPASPQLGDYFGSSMAMRGGRLLVGASSTQSVHFFARTNGVWSNQKAFGGGAGFPASLGIDGNAGTAVAGGFNVAYAFAESAGTWAIESTLAAPVSGKKFGAAAGVSGDAIVVGARDDDGAVPGAGAAYVFRRSGGTWSQTQKLTASDGALGDRFGEAVGMANGLLVIGAPYTDVNGADTGAIYVFEDQGGTYVEQMKLLQDGNSPPKYFGQTLSFDGARVAVTNSNLYVFTFVTPGAPCAQDAECSGGFCVDGVCCSTACGGGKADDCVACSVAAGAAQDGICGPIDDGAICDDHDVCSAQSACQGGACVGQSITVCPSPGACQVGACDPMTGLCGGKPAPQGTACDDGNACTQFSICGANSTCVGLSPITCAGDACNDSACDPASGACHKTPKADGTVCDDGDPCTATDLCTAGTCAGAPVVCTAPDECHDAGSCGAAGCTAPAKPDGTSCSLGTCQAGVCTEPGTSATSTASSSAGAGGAGASSGSATTAGAGGAGASSGSATTGGAGEGGSGSDPETSGGCGCVVAGAAPGSWTSAASLVALASLLARRRRRGPIRERAERRAESFEDHAR